MLQQQQQQQQEQHPLLAAVSGNNYALSPLQRAHYSYAMHRPMLALDTNSHGYYTGSAASGHGVEPSGSEYHASEPAHHMHPPSGGGNSYHLSSPGTSYAAAGPPPSMHHQPPPQYYAPPQPVAKPTAGSKKSKKRSGTSVMSALTLLSFFFFVNMLQNCLKDHMNAMNPTVMVMTTGVVRSRYNKLAEMNSREQQQSTSPTAAFTSGANIVVRPGNVVSAEKPVAAVQPSITIQQTPYSGGAVPAATPAYTNVNPYNYNNDNNNKYNTNNIHNQAAAYGGGSTGNRDPRPDAYEPSYSYTNHTLVATTYGGNNRYGNTISNNNNNNDYNTNHGHDHHHHHHLQQQQQHYYPDQRPPEQQQHHTYGSDPEPSRWPYGAAGSPISSSSSHTYGASTGSYKHNSGSTSSLPHSAYSPASSSSLSLPPWSGAQAGHAIGGNNYFNDGDDDVADDHRYGGEAYYSRIN